MFSNNNSFMWIILILLFSQGDCFCEGNGLILILFLLLCQGNSFGNCGSCEAN